MTDIFSHEKRSEVMRSIKGKHTRPELQVRRALHRLGFRYKLHDKSLPGTPDIVLRKYKCAIFVNGCFWHGHNGCRRGTTMPKTRTDFWTQKISSNKLRDEKKIALLKEQGWKVIVIHECELKRENIQSTINGVSASLKEGA